MQLNRSLRYLILFLALPLSGLFAETTVRSSHTAAINVLLERAEDKLLISAGEDGSIKIWDSQEGYLVSSIQASHLGIPMIAVAPEQPRIAVVSTDGINTFRLEMWDWESRTKLFSKRIEEVPLFLRFSPSGDLLVYGKTDWESLTFLDAERGFERTLINEGFGIVSSVYITASEKTLLSYSPSGSLRYYDLESGEPKAAPIKTQSGLEKIQFSPDGLYLFAVSGNTLSVTSLVNGSVLAQARVPGFIDFSLDETGRNIAILLENSRGKALEVYTFNSREDLVKLEVSLNLSGYKPEKIIYRDNEIFSGDDEGRIVRHHLFDAEALLFARPMISQISDIDLSEKGMLLTGEDGSISLIQSDLFEKEDGEANYFRAQNFPAPFPGKSGAISLEDGSFLIFSKENSPASLVRFNPRFGTFTRTGELDHPVIEARHYGREGNFILLDRSGAVHLFNGAGRKIDSQKSFGIRSATIGPKGSIIAGKSRSGTLSSALLEISLESGETVPLESDDMLVFRTVFNENSRTLYTLGYEERRGKLRTVLKSRDGNSLSRETTLLTFPGEDPNASFLSDREGTALYTSLGYSGVLMLEWDGFTQLERFEHIPRSLSLHNNLLFALNRDSSISIWDTKSGSALLTIYLLDEGNWAAVYKDGRSFSSDGARRLLHSSEM